MALEVAPQRALAAGGVVIVALLAGAAGFVVHRSRSRWSVRVDGLCACSGPVRRQLESIAAEATGGLAEAAIAQAGLLQADCDDLRTALGNRTVRDELRKAPLEVAVTAQHRARTQRVSEALTVLCDGNTPFWRAVEADLARTPAGAEDPYHVRATAAVHVALHDAMCARREVLAAAPASYRLAPSDAEAAIRACDSSRGARAVSGTDPRRSRSAPEAPRR